MPPSSRTPSRLWCTPTGSPWPRRLLTLVQGALLLVIALCAVAHAETDEPHGPIPAAVTALDTPTGEHEPHPPHGAHECASDAFVRTTAQSPEPPLADAETPATAVAAAAVLAHPRTPRGTRRRRRPRTGRAALVRTSRWRI